MPIVKVWLLPDDLEQSEYERLWEELFAAFERVPELGLSRAKPKSVTFCFPRDHMQKGLGAFVWAEVEQMFDKPGRTDGVKFRLARELGQVLIRFFPQLKFSEVFVDDVLWFWDESHGRELPTYNECYWHGSKRHMQMRNGKCPGCWK